VPTQDVTVTDEVGLHARPAGVFVKTAGGFEADVTVTKEGASANGKSLLSLLKLDVQQGDTVTISTDGSDADEALAALVDLVEGT
jgi:phosphocarrier protein HPr